MADTGTPDAVELAAQAIGALDWDQQVHGHGSTPVQYARAVLDAIGYEALVDRLARADAVVEAAKNIAFVPAGMRWSAALVALDAALAAYEATEGET